MTTLFVSHFDPLGYLATYDLRDRNEQAIREEWIGPFLRFLGYLSKGGRVIRQRAARSREWSCEPLRDRRASVRQRGEATSI